MINFTLLCANRPRLLKQALESIGDISDATITIRDAGMNPEVGNVAVEWLGNHDGHYLRVDKPTGTGQARNHVVRESDKAYGRGSHLYMSDDDVYWVDPNWLKILTTAYEEAWEHGFRALACYNHPYNRPCSPAIRLPSRWNVDEVYAIAPQTMLMRWEVWDEYGPFCDTPAGKVCQSEDVDFCNKIRERGLKVGVISPPLLVNCGITNSFGQKIPGWELVLSQAPRGVVVE